MNTTAMAERGWEGTDRRAAQRRKIEFAAGASAHGFQHMGEFVFRYGLASIFLWAGLLKFTAYEAKNIEPMVTNSPIWSWMIPNLGLQGVSNVIGVIEISIGLLIATRAFWPKASAIGSIAAVVTFLITLTFLLTTPGVWEPGYGFGFLSAMPGQFLAKDLVLLGVSIWTAAEAWKAAGTAGPDRSLSDLGRR